MRKLLALLLTLWIAPALAQVPMTGAGKGTPAGYVGPGDLGIGSFDGWYSCATAFTSAFAATLGAVCDVVDSATGLVTCTFHMQASGQTNPAECNASACATACKVTKAYDQTGNGRDASQVTLSAMPTLTLSALNGLPGMTCSGGTCIMSTASFTTRAQPYTYVSVATRPSGGGGGAIGDGNGLTFLGFGASNLAALYGGTSVTATASDASYHATSGLASGSGNNCALNVDGSDTASLNCGTTSAMNGLRIHRGGGTNFVGTVMEAGMIGATTTSGNRNSYSSNAHTRYSF